MKTSILCVCLFCLAFVAGCGPETTAGGIGLTSGIALSNTIKGMQADLERREAALVQRYNDLLAAGAKAEDLEAVKQQIENTVNLREGVATGEHLLGVDWGDPAAAGGGIGLLATLAWSVFSKRKLSQKYIAMKAGQAQLKVVDPVAYEKSFAAVGLERAKMGL